MVLPLTVALGTITAAAVAKTRPSSVDTRVPCGTLTGKTVLMLSNTTDPVALVSVTFLPVAG